MENKNGQVVVLGAGFGGFSAWLAWLGVHLISLIGFRNRAAVLLQWAW
jgi:NADH dehydrogenase